MQVLERETVKDHTTAGVPCHLVVLIVVNTLDDIDLSGL